MECRLLNLHTNDYADIYNYLYGDRRLLKQADGDVAYYGFRGAIR